MKEKKIFVRTNMVKDLFVTSSTGWIYVKNSSYRSLVFWHIHLHVEQNVAYICDKHGCIFKFII